MKVGEERRGKEIYTPLLPAERPGEASSPPAEQRQTGNLLCVQRQNQVAEESARNSKQLQRLPQESARHSAQDQLRASQIYKPQRPTVSEFQKRESHKDFRRLS